MEQMNVYFQPSKNAWFHNAPNQTFVWGFEDLPLRTRKSVAGCIPFPMRTSGDKVGPIIGILTGQSEAFLFEGNKDLFKMMQKRVMEVGGITIVFTPEGITNKYVNGFLFIPDKNSWAKARVPLPDVIYNRIPDRAYEQSDAVTSLVNWLKKQRIPFFNPHFFSKWETFQHLCQDDRLATHLPDTCLPESKKDVMSMLNKHGSIYLKPDEGLKGNGIIVLNERPDGIEVSTHLGKRLITKKQLWKRLYPILNRETYIIQERVPLETIEGRPFDFRVLVHRIHTEWHVTAIGIRQASKKGITTHVPHGGNILRLEDLSSPADEETIKGIASRAGNLLMDAYGRVGEFSMDIGRNDRGHYYLFEINSKPMRFDEPQIREKGIKRLVSSLTADAGF